MLCIDIGHTVTHWVISILTTVHIFRKLITQFICLTEEIGFTKGYAASSSTTFFSWWNGMNKRLMPTGFHTVKKESPKFNFLYICWQEAPWAVARLAAELGSTNWANWQLIGLIILFRQSCRGKQKFFNSLSVEEVRHKSYNHFGTFRTRQGRDLVRHEAE